MKAIEKLYRRTKESLAATHRNQPDTGMEIIREVQQSIKMLRTDNPELSEELDTVEVIALNNLACAYNRKGKYKAGLFNLQQARAIEQKIFPDIGITRNPEVLHQVATTHSNLCAILSQMGEHQKALKQIQSAIALLLRTPQTSQSDALAVFFYNCTIEYEYLHKLNDAKKQAEKGLAISKSNLEMRKKLTDLVGRLEEKIKLREQKIGNYLMNQYKSRTISNSLHNISCDVTSSKIIAKQFSTYQVRMPNSTSPARRAQAGFPSIKLPSNLRSSKQLKRKGFSLGLDSRSKVLSLYTTQAVISNKNKRNLSKRKQTLQKLSITEDQ